MKRSIFLFLVFSMCAMGAIAQKRIEGTIDKFIQWSFDGQTLTIYNTNQKIEFMEIPDYDNASMQAPWFKKKFANEIERVVIQKGISRIGSCAFVGCKNLTEVIFQQQGVTEIGWGAFMNCKNLRTISFPITLASIETIAFANCTSLSAIQIPAHCKVGEQAFVSCDIKSLDINPTATIGSYAFAKEEEIDGNIHHFLYNGEILKLANGINTRNCHEYGLAFEAVDNFLNGQNRSYKKADYDLISSDIDIDIPVAYTVQNDIYALIIGNQNYYWGQASVPSAIHDAHVFATYCSQSLGVPAANIKAYDDATKMMINEEAFDWLENINDRTNKRLIVYYAGHGVPDLKKKNEAYLLPTDVRGSSPRFGIRLNDFYARIGELGFSKTAIFMDACFSGGFDEGTRGAAVAAEDVEVQNPSIVVFSAAQGNEESQQYPEQGHGLFTYYLLKDIQTKKQNNNPVFFGDLSDNIRTYVQSTIDESHSRLQQQTPNTQSGDESWRDWSF